MLSKLTSALGFIIAGNADIAKDAARLLQNGRRDVRIVGNVFPRPGEISIHHTREAVRDLFLLHITKAKGLNHLMGALKTECEPTPLAVSRTLWALQEDKRPIVLVDLGGATTDVHSIGGIFRKRHNAELPAPDVMRTVEGDLGMRWGAPGVVTAMRSGLLSKIESELDCDMEKETRKRRENPSYIPLVDKDRAIDNALAVAAVSIAIERHAGRLMVRHLPWGDRYYVDGKDLRPCQFLVATGGAFQYVEDPRQTVMDALSNIEDAQSPINPRIVIDAQYCLYAVGLVARYDRNFATKLTENLLLFNDFGKTKPREIPAP
jgi:uncharacterized protein (TIGR01319 family)